MTLIKMVNKTELFYASVIKAFKGVINGLKLHHKPYLSNESIFSLYLNEQRCLA